jgi:hypothetical protein
LTPSHGELPKHHAKHAKWCATHLQDSSLTG